MNRFRTCLTTAVLLTMLPLAAAQEPAEWAPDDAIVYIGVTDVERTIDDLKQTKGYQMMQDPEAAKANPGMQMIEPAINRFRERLAELVDMSPDKLENPFKGPLTLYVAAPRGAGTDDMVAGLVAGVGDQALMKKYYDGVVEKLKKIAKHDTEQAGGQLIHVFSRDPEKAKAAKESEEDDEFDDFDGFETGGGMGMMGDPAEKIDEMFDELFSADAIEEPMAMCLTDTHLVFASTTDEVKTALKRLAGGKTLAAAADHQALLKELRPLGTVRFLVNLPRIIDLAKSEIDSADSEEMKAFQQGLKTIGAKSLRSLVGHMRFGANAYDIKLDMTFLMEGERTGLAKVLSMKNRPTAPPSWVASDTCTYLSINMEVGPLVDEVLNMVREGDPMQATMMQSMLDAAQLPGSQEPVNLRQTLLTHLKGPLTASVGTGVPVTPDSPRLLLTLGHDDQQAVSRFLAMLGLQPVEHEGTQVFQMPLPMIGMVGVAASGERVLAGSPATVQSALGTTAAPSLTDTTMWREASRVVPEQSWLTMFVDSKRMMSAAIELLPQKQQAMMSGNPATMMLVMMTEGMDATDSEQLRKTLKYTGTTIMTVSTTDTGVRMTWVEVKAE